MKINKEVLKSLKPCVERWENYLTHYSKFDGSFEEFIDLEKVSYGDKIWVAKKVLNKNQLIHFAILCAQSVLDIYEKRFPNDKRIRDCIEYLMTIQDFSSLSNEQLEKIRNLRNAVDVAYVAATYAAYVDAAAAAASYAAYAAAAYVVAAAAAAVDAAYAAAVDAAAAAAAYVVAAAAAAVDVAYVAAAASYAAAVDAAYDTDAIENQRTLNLQFLKMAASL